MILHDFTVYDIFEKNARLYPEKTAIKDTTTRINYHTLLGRINGFARGLEASGIKKGDRLAVLAMNKIEYLILYGAAAALGAIAVPLNWRLSDDEITFILKDSNACALFFDTSQRDRSESIAKTAEHPIKLISFDNVKTGTIISFQDLIIKTGAFNSSAAGEDLFCLIYTAAVGGHPRGAALSHSNIIAGNVQTCIDMKIDCDDAYLNLLPLFHITGMNLAFSLMHSGGKNVIMEKFNGADGAALIEKENISILASFPPILTTLYQEMEKGKYTAPSLRYVTGIDSPENTAKFSEKTKSVFKILYGQSETSGFVTLGGASSPPGSAGKQCLLSKVSIRNDEDEPCPAGEIGEICVQGPVVFQGYWDQGKLDGSSFKNNWHHTGDNGKMDRNGFLWFKGRKPEKELIKPGGENVYPAEVEAVIMTHEDVIETCVIGVPDPRFGEGIKAVCVIKKGALLEEKELIEFVGQRIARYKKPGYVSFVESLPKNDKGDIDRNKVKSMYTDESASP
ncbi:MAG: AMP-binding protein [Thermodesulfobacteriota bacterium]|nr:AMP-binding protein [Thermodesulfobacteriota bacterium]